MFSTKCVQLRSVSGLLALPPMTIKPQFLGSEWFDFISFLGQNQGSRDRGWVSVSARQSSRLKFIKPETLVPFPRALFYPSAPA